MLARDGPIIEMDIARSRSIVIFWRQKRNIVFDDAARLSLHNIARPSHIFGVEKRGAVSRQILLKCTQLVNWGDVS